MVPDIGLLIAVIVLQVEVFIIYGRLDQLQKRIDQLENNRNYKKRTDGV